MKKYGIAIVLFLTLGILSSCTGLTATDEIYDYYGDYSFRIPFNHSNSRMSDMIFFETDYSMQQMVQLLNEAGYLAGLHENGNVLTIHISAVVDGLAHSFIIYDKNHLGNADVFTLSNAAMSITNDVDEGVRNTYRFLAPLHILDTTTDSNMKRVFGCFEHIANFYRGTGRNDVEIDVVNKVIFFESEGNPSLNWAQGTVMLQFIETNAGNYLYIRPLRSGE